MTGFDIVIFLSMLFTCSCHYLCHFYVVIPICVICNQLPLYVLFVISCLYVCNL